MNCFDDLYLKDIDIYSGPKYRFDETIDYLSNENHISDTLLIRCHKSCLHFDMSVIIPSTASIRLQNIAWRRLDKNLFNLNEVNPQAINWYKDYDINWCYGPKYLDCDLIDHKVQDPTPQQLEEEMSFETAFQDEVAPDTNSMYASDYDSDCESESVQSTDSLMSYNSMDSSSSFETSIKSSNSNIKTTAAANTSQYPTNKRVKFNYIVSSREIINGIAIDYDFLDDSMLHG